MAFRNSFGSASMNIIKSVQPFGHTIQDNLNVDELKKCHLNKTEITNHNML